MPEQLDRPERTNAQPATDSLAAGGSPTAPNSHRAWRIGLLAALLLAHSIICILCVRAGWITAEESGGIENVQATLCFLSVLWFAAASWKRAPGAERLFCAGLALLCFSFFMREVDVQEFNVPRWLKWLCSPAGRNLWLAACWVVFGIVAFGHRRDLLRLSRRWLRSSPGHLLLATGGLFILAHLFDAHVVPIAKSAARLWEEVIESNGFVLLWICSLNCLRPRPASDGVAGSAFSERSCNRPARSSQK